MGGLRLEVRGLEAGGRRLADQLASTHEQLEEAAMAHGALQARPDDCAANVNTSNTCCSATCCRLLCSRS